MNRRILLIDADPAFRASLTQQLERYRFEIAAEPDTEQALAQAAATPPALLMVSVEEPDKAGFKIFQRCKKGALAKVPIVLVTSSVSPDSFAKHRGLKVHAGRAGRDTNATSGAHAPEAFALPLKSSATR